MGIRAVLDRLVAANEAYRRGDAPIMTDAQYDALEDALAEAVAAGDPSDPDALREAEAFLAGIGAAPADDSGWVKVRHDTAMSSLNKAQDAADARSWAATVGAGDLVVSEKLDGISISLKYVDGALVRAATRGDGETGEDITRNVLRMKGVVRAIKDFTGHVRGEIVLRRSDHTAHFPAYSNPRNAAAGVAKRLDGSGSEHLTVYAYQIVRDGGATPIRRKRDELTVLGRLGFPVPNWQVVPGVDAAVTIRAGYDRDALDYDIDGLVLEVDDLERAAALGELNHRPRGSVAYKFSHMTAETTLRDIVWQVGKSGRLTPVAVFDPVMLAGARVERASLATPDRVTKLRLSEGCRILVSRRNDVIPRVEANLDEGITND
jgi:DNA ligase (NAD+)